LRDKSNILQLIETTDIGGAENVMLNLASSLNDTRFNPIVCLRGKGQLYEEALFRGLEAHILKEKGLFDLRFIKNLLDLVKTNKVVIIHAHEFLMSMYSAIVGWLSGIPVVATLHGKFYYTDKWRRRWAMRLVANQGRLVCVSDDLRKFVADKLCLQPQMLRTIYNGIDLHVNTRRDGSKIRAELGIPSHHKIIGTVANLHRIKGHIFMLQAVTIIIKRCSDITVVFAGAGDEEQELRTYALNLGIDKYVRFLGFRKDIPDLLSALDIFVLPSLSECFPLSLLEAMACSVPVIATNVGGVKEIIEDGKTGYIVPPGDPDALAAKSLLVLEDKRLSELISCNARERITGEFSLEAMLKQYLSLYDSLV